MSTLSSLYQEISHCQQCGLAQSRTKIVPGEGAEDSDILFIGEAPGWNEDQQGRPFVGAAGKYLEELLASIDLKREQVYIANVIKCRPPENRDPLPEEIKSCHKWLERQIELISPRVIVTLGRYSMALFFPGKTIGKIHGTVQKQDGVIHYAMYHPAAAFRQQKLRQSIEDDMRKIPALLAEVKDITEVEKEPQQLKMFEV